MCGETITEAATKTAAKASNKDGKKVKVTIAVRTRARGVRRGGLGGLKPPPTF